MEKNCGKEYSAMKGSNTCTRLFSINKHYNIKYSSYTQVQIEAYIRNIVFIGVVTKYDLNGPNMAINSFLEPRSKYQLWNQVLGNAPLKNYLSISKKHFNLVDLVTPELLSGNLPEFARKLQNISSNFPIKHDEIRLMRFRNIFDN